MRKMNASKEGTVYTPEKIAFYIAKTSIESFLLEKINNNFSSNVLNLDKFFENLIQRDKCGQFSKVLPIAKCDIEQLEYIFEVLKRLTVLDPAVGRGHILVAALKVLEKIYLKLKSLEIIDWSIYKIREYIISNSLYGVDIDKKAIRITKNRLSLTLTDFESESIDHKAFSTIDSNFKLGNAIIGFVNHSEITNTHYTDLNDCFYDKIKSVFQTHKDLKKLELAEKEKRAMMSDLKPFHWFFEFPEIMKKGGFDIIIENPPYISNKQMSPLEKAIYQKIYETPKGLMNTFGIFIERSIKLCHPLSRISYIVHKNIIRSNNYDLLRKYLLENTTIEEIMDVGAGAFESITAETIIIVLKTVVPPKNHEIIVKVKYPSHNHFTLQDLKIKSISQKTFLEQENYNINLNLQYKELELINYIKENKDCDLFEFFEAKTCIATGEDDRFLANYKANNSHRKTLRGKNIGRFYIDFDNLYVEYNPKALHRARDESIFLKPEKLIMQTISSNLTVAYDNNRYYPLSTCIAIIPKDDSDKSINIKYLLLLMNSKLLNFYYDFVFNLGAHLTTEISVNNVNHLPLKLPNNYKVFNILADAMIRINEIESLREESKEFVEFTNDLIDILIDTIVFKDKFRSDGLNIDIINQVSEYLIKMKQFSIEQIQTYIKNIRNDESIENEIQQVKNHPWVKIIEDYFKKNKC